MPAVLLAVLLIAVGIVRNRLIVLENTLIDGFLTVAGGGLGTFFVATLMFLGMIRGLTGVAGTPCAQISQHEA